MRDITFEDVCKAIKNIAPVPAKALEREKRLKEELEKLAGQSSRFLNTSGEDIYSPVQRYDKFVNEGS